MSAGSVAASRGTELRAGLHRAKHELAELKLAEQRIVWALEESAGKLVLGSGDEAEVEEAEVALDALERRIRRSQAAVAFFQGRAPRL